MNSLYSAVTDTLSNLFFGRGHQEADGGGGGGGGLNNSFTIGTNLDNPLRDDLRRGTDKNHHTILQHHPGKYDFITRTTNYTIGGGGGTGKNQRKKFSIYSPQGAFQTRMGGITPNVFGASRPRSSGMIMGGNPRGAGGTGES